MKIRTLLISTLLMSMNSFAQEWEYNESLDSTKTSQVVKYINTHKVDDLLEKKRRVYSGQSLVKCFRIQIYSGSRTGSTESLNKFKSTFPSVLVETSYEQPYFKTKVAAFRTRIEAERALLTYKKKFKAAFIFEGKVSLKQL